MDPDYARLLAQIMHAAYLLSGSWKARFTSILIYTAYLMKALQLNELVEALLLAVCPGVVS